MMPPGVNAAEVIDLACRRYNLALGAGLARMAGRLFRIGHLGDLNELMLLGAIAGAEMAMRDVGIKVTPGSGVAAAEEYWRGTRRRWRAGPARERRTPSRSSRRRGRPPPPDDPYPANEPASPRLQRSTVAVPRSNPVMFRKALESEADNVTRNVITGMLERGYGRVSNISSINGEKDSSGR
jgi:hypothetical protein